MPPSDMAKAAPTNVGDGPRVDHFGGDQLRDTKNVSSCREILSPQRFRNAIEAAEPGSAVAYFVGESFPKGAATARTAHELYVGGVVELTCRRISGPFPAGDKRRGAFQYLAIKRRVPRPPKKGWSWNGGGE